MAAIQIETQPLCEPVDLNTVKQHLRVTFNEDDALLSAYISAAREAVEHECSRSFINKGFVEYLDSFPYWEDDTENRFAYPSGYYTLPRLANTMNNYSQMIVLSRSRLQSVSAIDYVDTNYVWQTLAGSTDVSNPTDLPFVIDINSEPPRIFPVSNGYWPPLPYGVPNPVAIHYIAGVNNDTAIAATVAAYSTANPGISQADLTAYEVSLRQADVPNTIKAAIMQLVSTWYANRESVSAQNIKEIPNNFQFLLASHKVIDYSPLRG